jgi:hypothetical protein
MPWPMGSLQPYLEGDYAAGIAALRTPSFSDFRDPEIRFYMARQASRLGDLDLGNEFLLSSVSKVSSLPSPLRDRCLSCCERRPNLTARSKL